jgi:membrane-associated HD superfamily phosphohydrolase
MYIQYYVLLACMCLKVKNDVQKIYICLPAFLCCVSILLFVHSKFILASIMSQMLYWLCILNTQRNTNA